MKTLKQFLLPVLDSLEFGWQVIRYANHQRSEYGDQTGGPGSFEAVSD
jgi:hypothetical protein